MKKVNEGEGMGPLVLFSHIVCLFIGGVWCLGEVGLELAYLLKRNIDKEEEQQYIKGLTSGTNGKPLSHPPSPCHSHLVKCITVVWEVVVPLVA